MLLGRPDHPCKLATLDATGDAVARPSMVGSARTVRLETIPRSSHALVPVGRFFTTICDGYWMDVLENNGRNLTTSEVG